ncbi:hypothetical protein Scep_010243 [Stephania cephalantha]|uniref:Uncharacterized protein n=1 Tax=Stephania cephalantha TaxID=152367 RepID=A0AAP0JUR2_9MAGN
MWLNISGEARIAEAASRKRRKDYSALTVAAAHTPTTMARQWWWWWCFVREEEGTQRSCLGFVGSETTLDSESKNSIEGMIHSPAKGRLHSYEILFEDTGYATRT